MAKLMKLKFPIRKRSFLLLELLIALALISLCLIPLLKPHAAMRKKEVEYLQKIQWDNITQRALCDLKEKLYENRDHLWKDVKKAQGELKQKYKLICNREKEEEFRCRYTLVALDRSQHGNTTGVALRAQLTFFSLERKMERSFYRTLYIERRTA